MGLDETLDWNKHLMTNLKKFGEKTASQTFQKFNNLKPAYSV